MFNSLKERTQETWYKIAHWSVGISMFASYCVAVTGYISFQNDTQSDVLNNFANDNTFINIARFLLAFTMVFTFPMEQVLFCYIFCFCVCVSFFGFVLLFVKKKKIKIK